MKLIQFNVKHVAVMIVFSMIAIAPMFVRGIPGGNDAIQHYEFAQHVVDAFQDGMIFPSFAGNANNGFGDVGLRVYPPLAYYGLAFSYLVFGEWYLASIATFFLIFLIGAVGVYLLAAECFSVDAGIAASAIYTFSPFHLNEIYNNFLFAEFATGAILRFCFLFVTRVIRYGGLANTMSLGVACALLIATHLPMTIIGAVALLVCASASLRKQEVRRLSNLVAAGTLTLVLSSFYWVRMISEMNWVKHSQPEYFSNIWSYKENFLISWRTFTNFMGDGQSLWFGDLLLISTLAVCVPAFIFLKSSLFASRKIRPLTILLAFSTLMTTPLSAFAWDNIERLQMVQFPWRWLAIVSLAASLFGGFGIVKAREILRSDKRAFIKFVVAISILPFVVLSAFVVRAPHFTPKGDFNDRAASLSEGETFEGWWPVWARREAFTRNEKVVSVDRAVNVESWGTTSRSLTLSEGPTGPVEVSTFYYPHWRARIDGQEAEVRAAKDGVIHLNVPAGASKVELSFREPALVAIASLLSVAGWTLLLITSVIFFFRKHNRYGTYS